MRWEEKKDKGKTNRNIGKDSADNEVESSGLRFQDLIGRTERPDSCDSEQNYK